MTKKQPLAPNDRASANFIAIARELECDEDEDAFNRALSRISKPQPLSPQKPGEDTPKK